ncbi:hypothetical protein AYI69_g4252 [Smittium culicis]|uniref:SCP domain-containing protein n=1 Tax=Smittium culicis TaxID=133412 RepID=A0A1R1XX03_9FUNG|nr:hypothetical protein AYI69_g6733 [Smittium culicis]OMJ25538.1 hypothetical protein AYI69_g4252 [Smittium culicis]
MVGIKFVTLVSIMSLVGSVPQDSEGGNLIEPVAFEPGSEESVLSKRASNSDYPSYVIGVVCETNKKRKENNLPPLKIYQELNEIAQKHTKYMVKRKTLTHEDDEGTLGKRLSKESVGWSFCAENVASGFDDEKKVVEAWMNSPGHRANILNTRIKAIGVGKDGYYWTQNFSDFFDSFKYTAYEPKC